MACGRSECSFLPRSRSFQRPLRGTSPNERVQGLGLFASGPLAPTWKTWKCSRLARPRPPQRLAAVGVLARRQRAGRPVPNGRLWPLRTRGAGEQAASEQGRRCETPGTAQRQQRPPAHKSRKSLAMRLGLPAKKGCVRGARAHPRRGSIGSTRPSLSNGGTQTGAACGAEIATIASGLAFASPACWHSGVLSNKRPMRKLGMHTWPPT